MKIELIASAIALAVSPVLAEDFASTAEKRALANGALCVSPSSGYFCSSASQRRSDPQHDREHECQIGRARENSQALTDVHVVLRPGQRHPSQRQDLLRRGLRVSRIAFLLLLQTRVRSTAKLHRSAKVRSRCFCHRQDPHWSRQRRLPPLYSWWWLHCLGW